MACPNPIAERYRASDPSAIELRLSEDAANRFAALLAYLTTLRLSQGDARDTGSRSHLEVSCIKIAKVRDGLVRSLENPSDDQPSTFTSRSLHFRHPNSTILVQTVDRPERRLAAMPQTEQHRIAFNRLIADHDRSWASYSRSRLTADNGVDLRF